MTLYIPQAETKSFFHSPILSAISRVARQGANNVGLFGGPGSAAAVAGTPTIEQQMLRRMSGFKGPSPQTIEVENRLRAQAEALRAQYSPATPAGFRTRYPNMENGPRPITDWMNAAFTVPTSKGPVIIAPLHGDLGPIAAVHEGFESMAMHKFPGSSSPIFFGRRLIGHHIDPKIVLGNEREVMSKIPEEVFAQDSGLKFLRDFRRKYNEYAAIDAKPYYVGPFGGRYFQTGEMPIDMSIGAGVGNIYRPFVPSSLGGRLLRKLQKSYQDTQVADAIPDGIPW